MKFIIVFLVLVHCAYGVDIFEDGRVTPPHQIIPHLNINLSCAAQKPVVVPFNPAVLVHENEYRSPTPARSMRSATPRRPLGTLGEGRKNMRACLLLTRHSVAPLHPDHRADAPISSHQHAEIVYELGGLENFEQTEFNMELLLADSLVRYSIERCPKKQHTIQSKINRMTVQLTNLRGKFRNFGEKEGIDKKIIEVQERIDRSKEIVPYLVRNLYKVENLKVDEACARKKYEEEYQGFMEDIEFQLVRLQALETADGRNSPIFDDSIMD